MRRIQSQKAALRKTRQRYDLRKTEPRMIQSRKRKAVLKKTVQNMRQKAVQRKVRYLEMTLKNRNVPVRINVVRMNMTIIAKYA